MIIIGYQGIGKSTLALAGNRFIDLESGNFWVDGKRADDWYKPYCQIAEHLSSQGYIVFTSSHKEVREQLKNSKEIVITAFPSLELKDAWINKLKLRWESSDLEKDHKAYANAAKYYNSNITDLMNEPFNALIIDNMDYNLENLIWAFMLRNNY